MNPEESPLQFPCDFPIKAFGRDTGDFDDLVLALVNEHAPEVTRDMLSTRSSRAGRYVAVTVNLRARSRDQLDRIYRALSAHERVLAAL
ncbi:MAG: DUF493 domain-containing protein [Halofilum sp. (in: g-proteobacteria)]|nr:DUF493 domain-containing protein [Halofilum sp. (in: g-proteobacteria)]